MLMDAIRTSEDPSAVPDEAVPDAVSPQLIIRDSVAVYESARAEPWQLEPSAEYIDRLLQGVVGFRIDITGIEGKWKLSQNQPPERREKVVRALREKGGPDAKAVADLMEEMR